jgi:hypothetical protein
VKKQLPKWAFELAVLAQAIGMTKGVVFALGIGGLMLGFAVVSEWSKRK